MKFGLAQMEVIPGNPERNIRTMLAMIEKAKDEKVDLIIFPELCISGYILSDMWVNESFCEDLMQYNSILLEASKGIAIAYGNIFLDKDVHLRWGDQALHPNKDGRTRKYNAVYVVQNGRYASRLKASSVLPEGIQPKTLLPDYRIFDDERYFFSFQDVAKDAGQPLEALAQPFLISTANGSVHIGFEICEDLWCQDYRINGKPLNLTNMLIDNGARMIINISASPWNIGKNQSRDRRILFLKKEAGENFVPFIYVNNTGAQNNGKNIITFDGGTTVYNRNGRPVLIAASPYMQDLIFCDDSVFESVPLQRKMEEPIRQKFDAIIQGIQHFSLFEPPNQPLKFVVGLSGGIDSAVVASLLVVACGKENVIAVNMPSQYNIEETKKSAEEVAYNLGINYLVIPIDDLTQANEKIFSDLDRQFNSPAWMRELSDENIQAKIRGTSILSNLAGRYSWLMTNNGNKLEIALGYATLYGDINGAVAPIGDLTKTEVYALARFLNEKIFQQEAIPSYLFPDELWRFNGKIIPSAELKHHQIDPMRFGYHCALLEVFTDYIRKTPEDVLQWYLDGELEKQLGISVELIQRWELDNPKIFVDDLEWFFTSIQKNIFKRIQGPPIIITSKSAYGYDIRESMLPVAFTSRYLALKEKVLKSKSSR